MDAKEKILDETHWTFVTEMNMGSIHTKTFPQAYREQALKAMDIHAKQDAIAFCQDVLNNIEVNGVRIVDYKKIDVEELYKIFKKQNNE
jgi:hypothetical protein